MAAAPSAIQATASCDEGYQCYIILFDSDTHWCPHSTKTRPVQPFVLAVLRDAMTEVLALAVPPHRALLQHMPYGMANVLTSNHTY